MNTYPDFTDAYPKILHDIIINGRPSAPRGKPIKEIMAYQFKLESINRAIPLMKSRKLNMKFTILEGLMNIAGVYPKDLVLHYLKNMENFMNKETNNWDGAYPPRIALTLESVYNHLKRDPDTRQAVIPILQPKDIQNAANSLDVPCTETLQFFIRDGKLCQIATMRSCDGLWGLGQDVNQFTSIQRALAAWLNIEPGWYIHQAASLHSYNEREENALKVVRGHFFETEEFYEFEHPSWKGLTYEQTMSGVQILMEGLLQFVHGEPHVTAPLISPFQEYYNLLTGITPIK